MTHTTIVTLAGLGIAGQALAGLYVVAVAFAGAGLPRPLDTIRSALWGYELWAAFIVASIATGGSLFFSEIAHYIPCELCWYQRICMYPLSILTLLAAITRNYRLAPYLTPFPAVGIGVSIYHLLVENGVAAQTSACLASAPGGCATKWINAFGYITIPLLALTAFVLLLELLSLAALDSQNQTT